MNPGLYVVHNTIRNRKDTYYYESVYDGIRHKELGLIEEGDVVWICPVDDDDISSVAFTKIISSRYGICLLKNWHMLRLRFKEFGT